MAVTSVAFVGFVLGVLLVFNVAPERLRAAVLLLASLGFYASLSLPLVVVLVVVAAAAYVFAFAVRGGRRWVLAIAIVGVLLPLLIVKYSAFAVSILSGSFGLDLASPSVTQSVGVSFFTFQAISYLVDVQQQRVAVERNAWRWMLHLAFFPKLLAGPIERASWLLPQLRILPRSNGLNLHIGAKLALWGFFCKLVVADNIAAVVDAVLVAPAERSGASLTAAFAAYAFQIYFDFLGYTYIAIGLARCFNVHLTANFVTPYAATSLRDFWHRWHITLSTWFRDYVYVPLGGNQTRGAVRVAQLLLVFSLSGLWHGAALTFVAWGMFHGVAYAMEEWVRRRGFVVTPLRRAPLTSLTLVVRRILVFAVVTCGWVLFRSADLDAATVALSRIAFLDGSMPWPVLDEIFVRADSIWFFLLLFVALALDSNSWFRTMLQQTPTCGWQLAAEVTCVNGFAVALVVLGDLGVRDFTYAQF